MFWLLPTSPPSSKLAPPFSASFHPPATLASSLRPTQLLSPEGPDTFSPFIPHPHLAEALGQGFHWPCWLKKSFLPLSFSHPSQVPQQDIWHLRWKSLEGIWPLGAENLEEPPLTVTTKNTPHIPKAWFVVFFIVLDFNSSYLFRLSVSPYYTNTTQAEALSSQPPVCPWHQEQGLTQSQHIVGTTAHVLQVTNGRGLGRRKGSLP